MTSNDLWEKMKNAIIEGDKGRARGLAEKAVNEGMNLNDVIEKGYTTGLQRVGDLWEQGEYFLPELITSAECMKEAMAVLQPALQKAHTDVPSLGRVVIGTIEGDIHDIGKNLVAAMLSAAGFEVIDLGADVKLEQFIAKAVESQATLVCLSALLTTTMLGQKTFVEMVRERGLAGKFRIMVGGAPVSRKWANGIGADGYGENAVAAVKAAKEIIGKTPQR